MTKARERFPDRLIRPRQGNGLVLGLRNLYILPTRFGWLWLLSCLVLYLLGINGGSNGPLLLGFLGTGLLLISLHLTQFNLQGLRLRCGEPAGGFAGETLSYPLWLNSRVNRYALQLQFRSSGGSITAVTLTPGEQLINVAWSSPQRGELRPGRLRIWSTAPLGLFHCWSVWEPSVPQLVYPQRLDGPVAVVAEGEKTADQPARTGARPAGSDDWSDLRPHRPEEGLGRLAWKQLARSGGRYSKRFEDPVPRHGLLALHPEVPRERGLCHLSARIAQLGQGQASYGLRLGDLTIPMGSGKGQRERCLRALARL
ncbi:hypothetical protein [Cyanobium sp. Morenito 9A2]|uniref:hypothetical protein n=1 Tax=Cyanobium sp. Morenito 9A2 TaxID=2823718 RepID=UPI0020CCBEDF|nr:hypothetical protein [Cyanobium sp. Morenito 9A2]MCP9850012.1 hypothetical protein [Cyanobium sp. Morenito 9A2]